MCTICMSMPITSALRGSDFLAPYQQRCNRALGFSQEEGAVKDLLYGVSFTEARALVWFLPQRYVLAKHTSQSQVSTSPVRRVRNVVTTHYRILTR